MRSVERRLAATLLVAAAAYGPLLARLPAQIPKVRVAVDANERHQTIDGFGAGHTWRSTARAALLNTIGGS